MRPAKRMPNAIQPHSVLLSLWSCDAAAAPAAAAAAGLIPVVAADVTVFVSVCTEVVARVTTAVWVS
jgi:hypothetical protein